MVDVMDSHHVSCVDVRMGRVCIPVDREERIKDFLVCELVHYLLYV